jgi:hypothetical protein
MGAKTWMLVYGNPNAREALIARPTLDRDATLRFVAELFPKEKLEPLEDGNLAFTCPPDGEICIGCFPGVSLVAAKEFGGDYPSRLPSSFIDAGKNGTIHLHAMHSVVDWFAFGYWSKGSLIRALSVSPDNGILEEIGERLSFESPFWAGDRPVFDDPKEAEESGYPFPFHPLELGEAALAEFFGYQLEGENPRAVVDPAGIPLMRFKRRRPWWKPW